MNSVLKAMLISENGTVSQIEVKDTLDELQNAIGGGHIEIVGSFRYSGIKLIIDKEGKFKDFERNHIATNIYGAKWDYIAGPALICEIDKHGELKSITKSKINELFNQ